MSFSIIVAHDLDRGIGLNGDLPWKLPEDMAHFRRTTIGGGSNVVIMGRKTWSSIPTKFRPLTKRKNIVLTTNLDHPFVRVHPWPPTILTSLDMAIQYAKREAPMQIFVIGGAQLYTEAIAHPECEKLYVTRINERYGCDTFFPEYQTAFELQQPHHAMPSVGGPLLEMQEWIRR
jgi:dihydrofolate reductase